MWSKKVCGLMAVLTVLLSACAPAEPAASDLLQEPLKGSLQSSAQTNVQTTHLMEGNLLTNGEATAKITYLDIVDVYWDSSVRIQELYIDRTTTQVEAGQLLATFDVEVSQAKLADLKMQLEQQEENYSLGKKRRKEAINDAKEALEGLTSHRLTIAQQELEKLQADYDRYVYNTRKTIENLETQIQELEQTMADNTLFAPISGTVKKTANVAVGDTITSKTMLIRIESHDRYYLTCASDLLRYNMEVTLKLGGTQTYKGRVISADNVLPDEIGRGHAIIALEPEPGVDPASMGEALLGLSSKVSTGRFQFVVRQLSSVPMLGPDTLHTEGTKYYVYTLDGEVPVKRYVTLAPGTESQRWVLNGVGLGDTLVLD